MSESSERLPSIPEPRAEINALYQSVQAIKQLVELLAGQRGSGTTLQVATASNVAATVADINENASALAADIATLRADLTTLQGTVSTNATTNTADHATINAAITALQGRCTALETRATNLESRATVLENQTAMVEIADVAITAVANIDITWTAGVYRYIEIAVIGFGTATAGTSTSNLRARVRQSGSFLTGASDYYNYGPHWAGAASAISNAAATSFQITQGGLPTSVSVPGIATIFLDPGASNFARILAQGSVQENTSVVHFALNGGVVQTRTAEVDGVRLFWESGQNFAAVGRVIVKGYKI